MTTLRPSHHGAGHDKGWLIASVGIIALLSLALHYGTKVASLPNVRDEDLMMAPIDAILQDGWSMRTAIDYQEVKGPVFFWMYAIPGEIIGDSINAMRFVSIAHFVLGGLALLLIAQRCGLGGHRLALVALLYVLAPYNAFIAQLLMSEPSFNCLALWGFYVFIRSFSSSTERACHPAGPIWFGILLILMLHHRPHALAIAGAVALTALFRDGFRAWPWLAACAVACLLRLPLYLRWGGLVTSHYQDLFGFGLRIDSLSYLLACLLPWTGVWVLAPFFRARGDRVRAWACVIVAGGAGLLLGWLATPDLEAKIRYVLPATGEAREQAEYAGAIATALTSIFSPGTVRDLALALLTGLGAASLAGLGLAALGRKLQPGSESQSSVSTLLHLSFWCLACGLPMYLLTQGPVYDRYLVVWVVLLPVAWILSLPRILLVLQSTVHAAMLAWLANQWLM